MTIEQLQTTLKSFRLAGMSTNLPIRYQEAKSHELDYLDFMDNLISDEQMRRQSNLLNRRIKLAKFPYLKTIDEFNFDFNTSVKKKDILSLASSAFVYKAQNVLFIGPPGVGKSHLAIALGMAAIHNGYTVSYRNAFDLVQELVEADTPAARKQYVKEATRVNLMIIDELGMKKMPQTAADDLLEIIHRRYQFGATIIATNRIVSDWGTILGDNSATSAILDRFLENSAVFNIKGKSYRFSKTQPQKED
jgi:DNA replication protein DnaC